MPAEGRALTSVAFEEGEATVIGDNPANTTMIRVLQKKHHRHQTTRMNFDSNLNPKHHLYPSNGTRDAERPEAGSHPSQVAQGWTTFHSFAPSSSAGSRRRASYSMIRGRRGRNYLL